MMHVVDCVDELVDHDWIPQLPNRQRSSLEELLDAILIVLENQTGAVTCVGHALKDSSFDLLVNDLTLKFAEQKSPRCALS